MNIDELDLEGIIATPTTPAAKAAPEGEQEEEVSEETPTDEEDQEQEQEAEGEEHKEETPAPEEKKSRMQKRLDELTREKYEAKREAERLKAELDFEKRQREQAAAPKVPLDREITLEDVDFDAERLVEAKIAQREAIRRNQEDSARLFREYESKAEQYAKENPDYAAFRSSREWANLPISTPMAQAILRADNPGAIEHAFRKNPDFALKLNRMSPYEAQLEIARLDGKLSASKNVAQLKTVTKAPPPVQPIAGGRSSSNAIDLSSDAGRDEWVRRLRRGK